MKANTGQEPAFPAMDMNSHMGVDRMELRYVGLTKREYFAAMAMQGMVSIYMGAKVSTNEVMDQPRLCAQWSVKFADQLLKALES